MNALICNEPGKITVTDIEKPLAPEGYTLLRIKHVGVCGTDLHAYEGTQPFFSYPRILGHELSGIIESTSAVGFTAGDTVTVIPYFNCGTCIACRNGKPNCCIAIEVCGVHIDGGMREYFAVPDYSLVHSNGLQAEELALVEPLAIGAHAVERAQVQAGEYVLVMGAGPIGLGVMEFARIAGGRVIAMDINAGRLNFCSEKLKVAHTVNAKDSDVTEQLAAITGNDMPTVIIDATGSLHAINNAFQYLAHGARYVLVGLQKQNISFSHPEFHKREATLMSSRNATRNNFNQVIQAIKTGAVNPATYITHKVAMQEVPAVFESWLKPETGVIKAMIAL